jgi:hypothetical protein
MNRIRDAFILLMLALLMLLIVLLSVAYVHAVSEVRHTRHQQIEQFCQSGLVETWTDIQMCHSNIDGWTMP